MEMEYQNYKDVRKEFEKLHQTLNEIAVFEAIQGIENRNNPFKGITAAACLFAVTALRGMNQQFRAALKTAKEDPEKIQKSLRLGRYDDDDND